MKSFNQWSVILFQLFLLLVSIRTNAELLVEGAWVKLAPPSIPLNAAYMKLTNQREIAQTITNVTANCCARVMLHRTQNQGDKVTMVHLNQLVIPANTSISLRPGDLHIMLDDPRYPLVLGTPIRITITFSDGTHQYIDTLVNKNEQ